MANCIFCNKDVLKNQVGLNIIGRKVPRTEIDILINVCSSCGGIQMVNTDHLDLLENGYPSVTDSTLEQIDLVSILDESVLPGLDQNEEKKWIDPPDLDNHPYNHLYESTFIDKSFDEDPKARRLVHFLLMDSTKRVEAFGLFRCPSVLITENGSIIFREGQTRFFLFKYMGASRIPVAITPEFAANSQNAGITLYDDKE